MPSATSPLLPEATGFLHRLQERPNPQAFPKAFPQRFSLRSKRPQGLTVPVAEGPRTSASPRHSLSVFGSYWLQRGLDTCFGVAGSGSKLSSGRLGRVAGCRACWARGLGGSIGKLALAGASATLQSCAAEVSTEKSHEVRMRQHPEFMTNATIRGN